MLSYKMLFIYWNKHRRQIAFLRIHFWKVFLFFFKFLSEELRIIDLLHCSYLKHVGQYIFEITWMLLNVMNEFQVPPSQIRGGYQLEYFFHTTQDLVLDLTIYNWDPAKIKIESSKIRHINNLRLNFLFHSHFPIWILKFFSLNVSYLSCPLYFHCCDLNPNTPGSPLQYCDRF